jgi:hypothetical protein
MKKGGAVREFNATFKASAMPEMKVTMGAGDNSFGGGLGGLGKENQKPSLGVGGWRPHPEPVMASAFRREVPTKLPPAGERPASPEKQGFEAMGSGLIEDKMAAAKRFGLRPKPVQCCRKHRSTPIEFACMISGELYCRICARDHEGHDDQSMPVVADRVQRSLNELQHLYLAKRTHVIDRLVGHQQEVEEFMSIFYQTLDEHRRLVLEQEYVLRD